jgi:hypothetical protein
MSSLKLSKFTPYTEQQRLKSYGKKVFFGAISAKMATQKNCSFFGHNVLTGHQNELPIAGLYSG